MGSELSHILKAIADVQGFLGVVRGKSTQTPMLGLGPRTPREWVCQILNHSSADGPVGGFHFLVILIEGCWERLGTSFDGDACFRFPWVYSQE